MTYDYICQVCQHAWEAEQRITDPALVVCPACGCETAKRLISGAPGWWERYRKNWSGLRLKGQT